MYDYIAHDQSLPCASFRYTYYIWYVHYSYVDFTYAQWGHTTYLWKLHKNFLCFCYFKRWIIPTVLSFYILFLTNFASQKKSVFTFGPIVTHMYLLCTSYTPWIKYYVYRMRLLSAIQADKLNEFACLLYM